MLLPSPAVPLFIFRLFHGILRFDDVVCAKRPPRSRPLVHLVFPVIEGLELGGMTRRPKHPIPPLAVHLIDRDCESRGEEGSYSTADENIQIASLECGSSAPQRHVSVPQPLHHHPPSRHTSDSELACLPACPGRLRAGLGTSARRGDSEERRKRPMSAAVPGLLLAQWPAFCRHAGRAGCSGTCLGRLVPGRRPSRLRPPPACAMVARRWQMAGRRRASYTKPPQTTDCWPCW